MYKGLSKVVLGALLALGTLNAADASKKIVVGATPVPHAEILEVVKPL